jgi:hypothetical protein
MVLLESSGRVVADDTGFPLVPVPVELVMSALDTVTGSAVAASQAGRALVNGAPGLERQGSA